MPQILTDNNFLIYAANHYDNPGCRDTKEFMEDIRRIKYIKKLITRQIVGGKPKTRLILNHIIILSNVFAPEPLSRILFLKMEDYLPYIKPFLVYLSIYQPILYNVKQEGLINMDNILMDQETINLIREI